MRAGGDDRHPLRGFWLLNSLQTCWVFCCIERHMLYIGWSDVTYLWSQCDRNFVGQHVVLCVVKWWRFVALFESNWVSWFKKMSVLLLSYGESDVYTDVRITNISQSLPLKMAKNSWYEEITSLSPYVWIGVCLSVSSKKDGNIRFRTRSGKSEIPPFMCMHNEKW